MRVGMKRQDLIELYQLLALYRRTYGGEEELTIGGWMLRVGNAYAACGYGENIDEAGNPRNAGRKTVYTAEQDAAILEMYRRCDSLRMTARQAGCSVGHVQDVIRRQKE